MKTIESSCTDEELSAAVAEHVLGWMKTEVVWSEFLGRDKLLGIDPESGELLEHGHFATDANAVLPLLEKQPSFYVKYFRPDGIDPRSNGFLVAINLEPHGRASAWRPTFARAACFALLRTAGITITDSAQRSASERGTTG